MRHEDIPRFTCWLTELVELFPNTKPNLEVLVPRYFQALLAFEVALLEPLLVLVLQQCRFFPTAAELLRLVATLRPTAHCPRCPGGHGCHTGHRVGHYELGPLCHDCNMDMPIPPGYRPPTRIAQAFPALPEHTATPPPEELAAWLADLYAKLDKGPAGLRAAAPGMTTGYQAQLTDKDMVARRQALRTQGEALGGSPPPARQAGPA